MTTRNGATARDNERRPSKLGARLYLDPSPSQAPSLDTADQATDRWVGRARPTFLYVMYVLLLWAIPMGLVAAFSPETARNIAAGMNAYLAGIPEPLYALFGTGYLGYTVAREWGKARSTNH